MSSTWGSFLKIAAFIAGAWLAISPWVLNFSGETTALWTSLIAGAILMVSAVVSAFVTHQGVLEAIDGVTGAALVATPFVLSFSDITAAMWDAVVVGVLVVALAITMVLTMPAPGLRRVLGT